MPDQPLMARCAICGEWCVYGVLKSSLNHDGGVILSAYCHLGPGYRITENGRYQRQRDAKAWAQLGHRCPQRAYTEMSRGYTYYAHRDLTPRDG